MPLRPAQFAAMTLWTAGVPILAYGLATTEHRVVSTGAWLVLVGSLAALIGTARVLAHVWR